MSLKECREMLGWNYQKTCRYLGISFSTYQRYENGAGPKKEKEAEYLAKLKEAIAKASVAPIQRTIDSSTDDFATLRKKNAYYVDKSLIIKEMLTMNESMILFARPRRFGKSLTLSMIKSFFDETADPSLFEGLSISKEIGLCLAYQNKYPVISLTFKDVGGGDYPSFLYQISNAVAMALLPFSHLLNEPSLSEKEKALFRRLLDREALPEELRNCMLTVSEFIYRTHHKKPIILIDEYDVPLQKASASESHYSLALDFMSGLLSSSLKGNPYLERGIVTGCLTIGKESIFTGLNNVMPYTVLDSAYSSSFGFNHEEVHSLLEAFGLLDKEEEVERYYDGYGYGLYCPFDVMRYVSEHLYDHDARPQYYWMNTSENEIILKLLEKADASTRNDIQRLIDGESILKPIKRKLTYRNLYDDVEHLFSVLVYSGYLVPTPIEGELSLLSIPNQEIQYIYEKQIAEWLRKCSKDASRSMDLAKLLFEGKLEEASKEVSNYLFDTIHLHDLARPSSSLEAFYHGILLPLLSDNGSDIRVSSNPESGEGYVDIALSDDRSGKGILIECKHQKDGNLEAGVISALKQAKKKSYKDYFKKGIEVTILGAAFYKKECLFGK